MTYMTGVYLGTDPSAVAAYDAWLGKSVDTMNWQLNSSSWSEWLSSMTWSRSVLAGVTTQINYTVPLIVKGATLATAAAHGYDSYYTQAAKDLLAISGSQDKIIVRVGEEFNGNWMPWAAGGKEADFAQAYRNFVDAFRSVSDKFVFEWNVAIGSTAANTAAAYPGDKYVDIISGDLYWDSTQSWSITDPTQAFNYYNNTTNGLSWLANFAAAHGKQTALSEWGVNSANASVFIKDVYDWLASHNVAYAAYWNSDSAFAGDLSNGQYGAAGATFQALFGVAASTTTTVPAPSTSTSTSGSSTTGTVTSTATTVTTPSTSTSTSGSSTTGTVTTTTVTTPTTSTGSSGSATTGTGTTTAVTAPATSTGSSGSASSTTGAGTTTTVTTPVISTSSSGSTSASVSTPSSDHVATVSVGVLGSSVAGFYRAYSVSERGGQTHVIDKTTGAEVAGTLTNIQFEDGVLTFDGNSDAARVMRLYDTVLHRAPDGPGLDNWLHALEAGKSFNAVAADFLNSSEFIGATGNLSNSDFIDFLYQYALGRAADPTGKAGWVAALDSGSESRTDVLIGFSESAEHRAQTAGTLANGLFETDLVSQQVAALYDTFAGRKPDAPGLENWVDAIHSGGMTLSQVAAGFAASAEFTHDIAGMNHTQVVDYLYENTLHRAPDSAGEAGWVSALDHGMSYGDLLIGFAESPEHLSMISANISSGIVVL